jgi:D-aminoacyl-tRNA deacylase
MRAVLQRVVSASVVVDGKIVGSTYNPATGNESGLLVLLGVKVGDQEEDSSFLARKTVELRLFNDEAGKMNKSVSEIGGAVLIVSQFTLLADWRKGRRPGFTEAAKPEEGERLYRHYVQCVKNYGVPVAEGIFAAHMVVSLINDGPVTIILDSEQ